jgi:fructose-bisphosphate aldolase, class I
METQMQETIKKLMARGKGILAADESNSTADKRLESVGAEVGEEMRRKYRELFLSADGVKNFISGVIFFDETIKQNTSSGISFVEHMEKLSIVPGIKVDSGVVESPNFPNEKITSGLETLSERLLLYRDFGLKFTKWRAVFEIDEVSNLPSNEAILENSIRLATYAKMVQEHGMVPIIEPEVLLDGKHSINKAEEITEKVLKTVFQEVREAGVDLSLLILKTSMVVPGNKSGEEMDSEKIAKITVKVLNECVPYGIGGVVFLSGGQTPEQARDNLNEIAKLEPLPFEIAFSYARAIQGPALQIWKGKDENVELARKEFIKWLKFNSLADLGKLTN